MRGTCARLWHEWEVHHGLPLGAITEIFFNTSISILLVLAFDFLCALNL